jgi:(1->4)-alpha-D-glucan 1-alpha-D-glucosylmutase
VRALAGLAAGDTPASASADDFAVRLQQTWGPVMAKGIEDTAFYRGHRLVALNEVGGDPAALGTDGTTRLHAWAAHQQAAWPRGMTALSTHDTKRSEDVRARLLAVAADSAAWERCSAVFADAADDAGVDRPTAHLVWQTLVGVGPVSADRLHGYLTKAVREAKLHTSWTDPDAGYEAAVLALADRASAPGALADAVAEAVAANAGGVRALVLGQKALQLLLPGCPDLYQGSELVDLSLVDPDNRRPVDYAERRRRLALLGTSGGPDGPAIGPDGLDLDQEKLRVVTTCLRARREHHDAFGPAGYYQPLDVDGGVGFVRGGQVACAAQTADGARGPALDGTTRLPPGSWHDRLGGRRHAGEVAGRALFADLPVAVLVREDP